MNRLESVIRRAAANRLQWRSVLSTSKAYVALRECRHGTCLTQFASRRERRLWRILRAEPAHASDPLMRLVVTPGACF